MYVNVEEKIKELQEHKTRIRKGGGDERIQAQHDKGKLTARERLDKLLDPGSFQEIGLLRKHRSVDLGMDKKEAPADGVVTGYGTIDGKLVYVYAQDFTVMGGSLGEVHASKISRLLDLAAKMGAPLIGLNDSGGARIQEGVDSLKGYGDIFYRNTIYSGVIPQLTAILGPCAGGAVYSPAIGDFIFMVKDRSYMFITGPEVVKEVLSEDVSFEELGGATIHGKKSGLAHFVSEDEEECIATIREVISYIPSNNLEGSPVVETGDDPMRSDAALNDVVPIDPQKPYDIKDVIEGVADNGEFLEVHELYARNIVVGFARMNGRTVGIVANQPKILAGCLDIDTSDKGAGFVRFCDAFNIPLVTFVDVPGYLPGTTQEHGGVIRHGAKLLYAYSEATVPKITIFVRKAYGGAYIGMCSKHLGADIIYALPSTEIAVMGPEGAANIIHRRELMEGGVEYLSEEYKERRKKKAEEYREKFATPYVAASRGYVDEVIPASDLRPKIIAALESCITKRETRPSKKHGNIPL
ncbi:methylmalonyl-CoA carboxyltransferase [archaeon]|nr:MAG: methylmalonyl-CoA carboxyltransferase [archaeon]